MINWKYRIGVVLFHLTGLCLMFLLVGSIIYLLTLPRPVKTPEQIKQKRYIGCLENVNTMDAELCNVWNK